MKQLMTRIWNDESGQDMAEYAIMLGVIAVATITAVDLLGTNISAMFAKVNTILSTP